MSPDSKRKQRDLINIIIAGSLIALFVVILVLELAVALRYEGTKSLDGEVMLLGFVMWLYTVAHRVKREERPLSRTKTSELLFDAAWLIMFALSCLGLMIKGFVTVALWCNVVIALYFLYRVVRASFSRWGIKSLFPPPKE